MKKDFLIKFNTITNILILFLVIAGGFVWADTNGIWLRAEDVRPGVFGADEMPGDFTFDSKIILNEQLCLEGNSEENCHSNWDSICNRWLDGNAIN